MDCLRNQGLARVTEIVCPVVGDSGIVESGDSRDLGKSQDCAVLPHEGGSDVDADES